MAENIEKPIVQKQKPNEIQQIKIRQFEWYEIETRVRQTMAQILQPFNKKQTQQTIKLNQIRRQVAAITKKQQQHDFLLEQEDSTKPKYIQLQDNKIAELFDKFIQLKQENDNRLLKMQDVVKIYEQKIKQLNKLENKLDHEIQTRIKIFDEYKVSMDIKNQEMLSRIQAQTDQINMMKGNTRSSINKFELKLVGLDGRTKELEEQMKRKTRQLKKNFEDIVTLNQRATKNQLKILQLQNRIAAREEDYKLSQKFMMVVEDVKTQLKYLENYIKCYQPLYNQIQISDTLNSFLKGKNRKLLCLYEEESYAKMHMGILNMNQTSLEQQMKNFANRIRAIIHRNRKFIQRLKVDKSLVLDQNVYETRILEDEDDDEEENKTQKIQQPVSTQISQVIQEKLLSLVNKTKKDLQEEIKQLRLWLQDLQDQEFLRAAAADQKSQKIYSKVQKLEAEYALEKQYQQKQFKIFQKKLDNYSNYHSTLKGYLKDMINFGSVINHIIIQDQIDRQGMALYALKGQISQMDKINPTIQFDEKCLACSSGNNSYINQAFKMACLSYNPSQIKIQQQIFSREQILQVSTNILQKLKQKMQKIQPNLPHFSPKMNQKTGKAQRRSNSQTQKQKKAFSSINSRAVDRSKEIQTLLPVLSSTRRVNNKSIMGDRTVYGATINF